MDIVYFGTDVFLPCFDYLVRHHTVRALYTYHNDEDYFTAFAITRKARALGIPVFYRRILPQEVVRWFREEGCGLFFLAEYDQRIPVPQDLPQFRGINVHSSLLPQGRSYYPIEAAMERDLPVTGVTLHKVTDRLDGGDILAQGTLPISPDTDSVDLYLGCAALARDLLPGILADLEGAWARALPQRERLPYWRRPADPLLTLEHRLTRAQAAEIFRRYNSLTQVCLQGQWYYVTALMPGAAPLDRPVWQIAADRWLFRAADGHLRLTVHPIPPKEAQP